MNDVAGNRLREWLVGHDDNLRRFAQLIPLSTISHETNLETDAIRQVIASAKQPIFHVWSHTHAGSTRPSKPYCLRLASPDTVCLDWEDSVVAAAEADFQRRGYNTCRELGTEKHIECLINSPELKGMTSGVNLRDLWAQRRVGDQIDFWIIEAKGKEAGGFDRYCFAEALSQLFKIPSEPLTALLGTRRKASHGLCFQLASQLCDGWRRSGFHANITLASLLPLWRPDVIWDGGTAKPRSNAYYDRPYQEFVAFIDNGASNAPSTKKGEAAFGQMLEGLESDYAIRALAHRESEICFRLLTTTAHPESGEFILREFPEKLLG